MSPVPAGAWKVATANIRHGLGPDGRVDLARTAAELRALGADVIGLQEVDVAFGDRSCDQDQAARLGELLGMASCFGAALDLPPVGEGRPRRRYGVALLTVHEVLEQQMHLLPPHPACAPPAEPRGVLRARLRRRDGSELEVLVTHLDSADAHHRTAQVQGIVEVARELEGPTVLMGDMNAAPGAPELAALAATGWREAAGCVADGSAPFPSGRSRALSDAVPGAVAAVAGRSLQWLREMTGLGGREGARATHPARFPVRRIDQIRVRGPVAVTALTTGPRGSSDHRPVVAELRTAV